jgi:nitrite reductase/ring-hydroxylating ferredoxin subunit
MEWFEAFPADALPPGGVKVTRRGRAQVAVFRRADGSLIAVDNRCPHEGYPLSQGSLCGALLTCAYHNYKFDVNDGSCANGEALAVHAVRERDGRIEVALLEPDHEQAIARRWQSWAEAMFEEREGQALRDVVRLLDLGVSADELAVRIAAWDADRGRWGVTHGAIGSWEALQLAEPGLDAVIALALPLQLTMRGQVRRAERAAAPVESPGPGAVDELVARVQREDLTGAEGLLRGLLVVGAGRQELEPAFFRMAAAHFLDFGHPLIYTIGLFDLLDRAGWQHAPSILVGLLHNVVNATREDVLPAWARYRELLDGAESSFPVWWAARGNQPFTASFDVRPTEAVQAVLDALAGGVSLPAVCDALVDAGSERILRFDPSIDRSSDVQDTWLSVTHCLTFAHAVREALARWDHPDALRLVLQSARMVAHHRVLDGPVREPTPREGDADGLADALVRRDPDDALDRVAWLWSTDPDAVRRVLRAHVLGDHAVQGIWAVHELKTVEAAFREARPRAVFAAVRFLAAPRRERVSERSAREALRFVRDGKTPRVLAP